MAIFETSRTLFRSIASSLFLLAVVLGLSPAAIAQTTVFEENFDTPAFGGDGVNSFVFAPVLAGATTPADADGYRCQYSDPDNPDSVSFGSSQAAVCFPLDANEWHVDTQAGLPGQIRSFSGDGAMHLGLHLSDALGTSYSTGQVAHATSPMITLDAGSNDYALRFRHIVSFVDWRTINSATNTGPDRGVVQVAEFDPGTGAPVSAWTTIQATINNYANGAFSSFFNCSFDPIDDGNTEDDLSTPPGQVPFGLSSSCDDGMGRLVYTNMGHALSVNIADVGSAPDGGGALGNLGPGVWVESVFGLNQFAGKTIKVRFLFSGLRVGTDITWEDAFNFNPDDVDDGWLIDDFKVTSETPLLVTLESFAAEVTASGVVLRWSTGMEIDNAGFRLLRERVGRREKSLEVITPGLIPAKGSNLVGADYEFTDSTAGRQGTFQYYLEDVDLWGRTTRHGPVVVQVGQGQRREASSSRARER